MSAANAIPRYLVYLVERSKLRAGIVFYGCAAALVLQLSSLTAAAAAGPGFKPIKLPYAEAVPHGPALESLALQASARPTLGMAGPAVPLSGAIWPLHGRVTTEFGAPDYPYQSRHTGIDITSAHPAGAMQVLAFKAGTVAAVVHSGASYGNHVIIDHGGGLTSLYGHLYSISVSIGQQVRAGDPIGTEGSTGA